jgi:hypothetical protein
MIPGVTSKVSESTVASASTISAKTDVVKLTGTVQVDTIVPNFGGGFGGILVLIPISGSVILSTAGNILLGATITINRATILIYSKITGKWHINSA